MIEIKAYMVHGGDTEDGAVLVFDENPHRARAQAWNRVSWLEDAADFRFFNLRARRMKAPHLLKEHTVEGPQVVECPRCCPSCETWGGTPIKVSRAHGDFGEYEACTFCLNEQDEHEVLHDARNTA